MKQLPLRNVSVPKGRAPSRCPSGLASDPPVVEQIWRINDLVYLPEEEALGELKRHRDYITGKSNRIADRAQESKAAGKLAGVLGFPCIACCWSLHCSG